MCECVLRVCALYIELRVSNNTNTHSAKHVHLCVCESIIIQNYAKIIQTHTHTLKHAHVNVRIVSVGGVEEGGATTIARANVIGMRKQNPSRGSASGSGRGQAKATEPLQQQTITIAVGRGRHL